MPVSEFTRKVAKRLAVFKRPAEALFALEGAIAAGWASNAYWRLHLGESRSPHAGARILQSQT